MNKLLTLAADNPSKLYLVDAAGALVSALMLGWVLPQLESFFGIPAEALYLLAIPPVVFIFIDLSALVLPSLRWRGLAVIAVANTVYCIASLAFLLTHLQHIRWPGMAYLLGEVTLVLCLAWVEWRVYRTREV
jgi:hypothetical protein